VKHFIDIVFKQYIYSILKDIYDFYINNISYSVALYIIGIFYHCEYIIKKDYKIALAYYKKSADLNYLAALNRIGYIYEKWTFR
jgi:TPR repeat protein